MGDRALIVVDVQHDFMPTGRLPVPDGDAVVEVANRLMPAFDVVVATQDWHPADHGSFASRHAGRSPGEIATLSGREQVLWPDHCVQGTAGAALHSSLDVGHIDRVFRKGDDPTVDSYSGFYDNDHARSTGLAEWLRACGVDTVVVLGLATDYCVRFTALDARAEGFETVVVEDGCRGVELSPGDVEAALDEMRRAGVRVVKSSVL